MIFELRRKERERETETETKTERKETRESKPAAPSSSDHRPKPRHVVELESARSNREIAP